MKTILVCCLAFITLVASSVVTPDLVLPGYANFVIAGLSGMTAWLAIHPGDVIKTRMQLAQRSPETSQSSPGNKSLQLEVPKNAGALTVARTMIKEEGFKSLYGGLSAAMARQASYTTLRLGLYDVGIKWAMTYATEHNFSVAQRFLLRQCVGLFAGAAASFASNPVEVCLVRMQSDGKLPASQRRNYKNIFDALTRITREEGIPGLWTGAKTTVIRAMVVSITQVVTYDQTKAALDGKLNGMALHAAAGVAAAFTFCTFSMPFDTVKTRLQASKAKGGEGMGTFGTIARIARTEGLMSLWRGYPPYLLSKGVLTILLFLVKEIYTDYALELVGIPK